MTILHSAVFTFLEVFVAALVLAYLSVVGALVAGWLLPRTRGTCARFVAGWRSRRRLVRSFLLLPLLLTLAISATRIVSAWAKAAHHTETVRAALCSSTRVVVRSGRSYTPTAHARVLFETEERDVMRELAGHISFQMEYSENSCKCLGDMIFEFYRGDNLHLAFSLHHGRRIRLRDAPPGDKVLSPTAVAQLRSWLEKKGVTEALERFRQDVRAGLIR